MSNSENDWVATGVVARGEYMRRSEAEAAEIDYTELTDEESRQVDYQLEHPDAPAWEVRANA